MKMRNNIPKICNNYKTMSYETSTPLFQQFFLTDPIFIL